MTAVEVRFTATCGTASSTNRLTDDDGRVNVFIRPAPGCDEVSVRIDVVGENGIVARTSTVTARAIDDGAETWQFYFVKDSSSETEDGRTVSERINASGQPRATAPASSCRHVRHWHSLAQSKQPTECGTPCDSRTLMTGARAHR